MTDPEQVVEANLKFYFALESQDIDLMDEVWATDASAICVHPGWTRLAGWENIRASWEQMFRNTNSIMRIDVSEVSVEVQGSTAWVSCLRIGISNRVVVYPVSHKAFYVNLGGPGRRL